MLQLPSGVPRPGKTKATSNRSHPMGAREGVSADGSAVSTKTDIDFDLGRLQEIPDPLAGRSVVVQQPVRLPSEPAPVRRQVRARRIAALVLSLGWVLGHLAVVGLRPDAAELTSGFLLIEVALPLALAAAAMFVALRPGSLGLGGGLRSISTTMVLVPVAFASLALLGPVLLVEPLQDSSLLGSIPCHRTVLLWSTLPLLLAAVTLRRTFPVGALWRAALVGTSTGLLGGAAINLHCPNADPTHVLLGHAAPALITTLVGALVVARWARV